MPDRLRVLRLGLVRTTSLIAGSYMRHVRIYHGMLRPQLPSHSCSPHPYNPGWCFSYCGSSPAVFYIKYKPLENNIEQYRHGVYPLIQLEDTLAVIPNSLYHLWSHTEN